MKSAEAQITAINLNEKAKFEWTDKMDSVLENINDND